MISTIINKIFYFILLASSFLYLSNVYLEFNSVLLYPIIVLFLISILLGLFSKLTRNINILIYSLITILVIAEEFTKRMTSFYFYEIPNEIINILFDTNLDEVKSNFHFSNIEYIGILIVFLSFFYLILDRKKKIIKYNKKDILFASVQIIFVISFFLFTKNPINHEVSFVINNIDNIERNKKIINNRNDFLWNAHSTESEKQIIVIFLGETHRGDYFSINGYDKSTTPRLEKQGIISYDNAISQAAYTLSSTPMILSRKNVNDTGIFEEKSLISAFKEAGFKTWYVSYLSPTHIGDNEINLIGNEADCYIRSSVNTNTLKNILTDNSNKKLIVYKTIGSHFLYHTRYPQNFEIFKPAFTSKDYSTPTINDKEKLENSYANSILYSVDYQINEFIELLKKEQGIVNLSFISDHGTSIYDDNVSLYGGNTKGNYNIGLFFWFNNEYIKKYPDDIYILKENMHKKITSHYFLDTIIHIGKIQTQVTKNASLFEYPLVEKPRKIKSKDIYDYDKDLIN
ncbi:phosphoethanolamine transferase [Proteus mirabilis]|nr:phosphoethanolamine transferase [Proteus mirabilis]